MAEHRTQPIPGERDPGNLTTREPGAVSGQFSGGDIPPSDHCEWMDETTARERKREGGGDPIPPKKPGRKKTTKKY